MEEKRDERTQVRLKMPGVKVYIKKMNGINPFKRFTKPIQLKDINESGASFTSKKSLQEGEFVSLHIISPGEEKINIKGYVRWTSYLKETDCFFTGMQFSPFGTGEGPYNSVQSMVRLNDVLEFYTIPPPQPRIQKPIVKKSKPA